MKQICPFCGEEKDTRHQALCPKNPNKRVLKSKLSNGDPDKVVPTREEFASKEQAEAIVSGELQSKKKPYKHPILLAFLISIIGFLIMFAVAVYFNKIVFLWLTLPFIIYSIIFYIRNRVSRIPINLPKTSALRQMQINQEPQKLTDEQKFLRFFGNLPKWTDKKPGWIDLKLAQMKYGDALDLKLCVLWRGKKKTQLYIPYNKDLGFLFYEDGFWDLPDEPDEPILLDAERFTPLSNRKNYRDEFDLPEDFAAMLVNAGIGQGQLKQFKELIAKIDSMKTINYLAYGAIVAMIVGIVIVVYIQNKHYVEVATELQSLTNAVKALKP